MIYICENYYFEFERMSVVEQCPDWGKMAIRPTAFQEDVRNLKADRNT